MRIWVWVPLGIQGQFSRIPCPVWLDSYALKQAPSLVLREKPHLAKARHANLRKATIVQGGATHRVDVAVPVLKAIAKRPVRRWWL